MFYQPLSFTICSSPFYCRQKSTQKRVAHRNFKFAIYLFQNRTNEVWGLQHLYVGKKTTIWNLQKIILNNKSLKPWKNNKTGSNNIQAWFLILEYQTV